TETGLQIYKFGKITSMPKFEADSFMEIVLENKSINAHSLILCDIGLEFKDALKKLEEVCKKNNFKNIGRIVVCSHLGLKDQRIYYGYLDKLEEKRINTPFCIIIPGKLHFLEEEFLKNFEIKEKE
ncbi:MAG: diphthine synthase, partial [Nanoarchaeota archaeon]